MNDPAIEAQQKCGICSFYIKTEEGGAGICRRYPPTQDASPVKYDRPYAIYPNIDSGWWCGEWRAK